MLARLKSNCNKWTRYKSEFIAVTSLLLSYAYIWIISLRELSHPNIVKFYGTNLQHGRNGTTVMIILELCSCSLRYHVMSHPEEAPARLPKEAVVNKVLGWALSIVDALRYIHSEGFVHRDLQLNNILVSFCRELIYFSYLSCHVDQFTFHILVRFWSDDFYIHF